MKITADLVAERVMGCSTVGGNSECWKSPDGKWMLKAKWDPLESQTHATEVVERMVDLGFTMTLIYGPQGDDVTFHHVEDGRHGFSKGQSVPRHISLAALRALGVEVE